jgi:Ni,Fe-hydrogenase III small subunit
MSLLDALVVRVGAVLLAAAVPVSTLAVVAAVEAFVAVPVVQVGGAAFRPTEIVAAAAVCQLAVRLYRLNADGMTLLESR